MSSTTPGGGFQALWEPAGATQPAWEERVRTGALQARNMSGFQPTLFRYTDPGFKGHIFPKAKDSFITQDRNEDFEGGQVESTFSQGHCDLTSGTISKNRCQMKDMDIIFP